MEIFFICFDFRAWALHTVIMNLAKFSEIFDKKKTFRPKKKFQPGTMKYSLHKQAQASLNSGINLRQVVKLPKGEDFNSKDAVEGQVLPIDDYMTLGYTWEVNSQPWQVIT